MVAVAGGARVSPLASAAARDAARARASKKALAPETSDEGKDAFASLAVAFASENMPASLDGGVDAWFASMPGLGLETLVRFVHVAVDVCVAAGHHRRASSLALELCDVVGTARVALDALPRALTSLRLCEAEDGEVGPARADAAESALRRARAAVPGTSRRCEPRGRVSSRRVLKMTTRRRIRRETKTPKKTASSRRERSGRFPCIARRRGGGGGG